jgi:predicted porin
MKRKAAALAVGALFAAPAAHAQISFGNDSIGTVQLYGKLYPEWISAKGQGSTQVGAGVSTLVSRTGVYTSALAGTTFVPSEGRIPDHNQRYGVDSQNSYIGFRGERNLGASGLKGVWQVEQSIGIDNQTPTANTFSNRNSFVGLSHRNFGTIKLGNMDTIYKEYGDTMQMFGIASGNFVSASNVLSNIGVGNSSASRFHERRANSVQYQTAEFGGVQAGVQYGPDEIRGDPGRGINASLWSYGVKWDSEHFYASVQQEVHNDAFGASSNIPDATIANSILPGSNTRSRDNATRFSGEVRFLGSQRIVLDVSRLHYVESGQTAIGRFQEYKKPTWAIGWDGGFGAWRFATQYVHAGSGTCQLTGGVNCDVTGLDGRLITVGARYRFDRQTFVYLIGAALQNVASSKFDNWATSDPNRGEDVKQVAVGISYSF